MSKYRLLVGFAVIVALVAVGWLGWTNSSEENRLVFADGVSFWVAPTMYAKTGGYFDNNKVDVDVVRYATGLAAKTAVVSGAADVGIVASTPLAAGFGKDDIRIIGTFFRSKEVLGLVTLAPEGTIESGISEEQVRRDWSGEKNRVAFFRALFPNCCLKNCFRG